MTSGTARVAIDVGSVIGDTYTIEAVIGQGGMGSVFVASHNRLPGKRVAIKLLHSQLHDREVVARFRREAEIASKLGHPNIVAVHDFNETPDGTPYLVLEYLRGETLAHRLQRGPLAPEPTLAILRQVGSALAAAHREGIVHRDLKPQNIFLAEVEINEQITEAVKVLDFGVSKIRGSQTVKTQDSALLGTPQYMAPEQALGQHDVVDARSDVFALGAIAYEMLTGRPAFSGESIPEVVFKVVYEQPAPLPDTISLQLAMTIRRAMAKSPEDRFGSVDELIEALTGQKLVVPQRPIRITAPPSGFGHGSNHADAHAETLASNPGAKPPATELLAAPPQPAANRGPGDPTFAPTTQPPAPTPRSKLLLVGIPLGLIAATVALVLVATRDRNAPASPPVAAVSPATIADAPSAAAPARADAAMPIAAAPPPDASLEKPPPTRVLKPDPVLRSPKPAPPTESDEFAGDDDPTIRAQLREADGALGVDPKKAEALALVALGSADAKPRQRALARTIAAIARCAANDEEKALAYVRGLRGAPKLRRRVLAACHKHGLLTSER
ncbi:MAG: serine/threonine-protein kinase [Kofleriaceae bacterium]